LDFGGGRLILGVGPGHRDLAALQPQLVRPNAEISQQLISCKDIPEGLYPRMFQVGPAVSPVCIGGVSVPVAGSQTDQRCMDQPHCPVPDSGGIDGLAPLDKSAALDQV